MRCYSGGSEISLFKDRNGKKEFESSIGKKREPREYSCRDAEIEGELALGFFCNFGNTERTTLVSCSQTEEKKNY